MNRFVITILMLLLSQGVFSQHLFTDRSAKRGEILNAHVYPVGEIRSSRFSLVNGEGRIVSVSDGFFMREGEKSIITALLGIPSDIEPGKYKLQVFCETEKGSEQFTKPFFVTDREFKEMDISLNGAMTDLRTSDDPRKAEESRELWALLSSFDKEADYYNGSFDCPVENYFESAFFGDRRRYLYSDGTTSQSLHNGSDLAAVVGEPVFAPAEGKVVMARFRILTGNTVVIEHLPGVYTLYYHLDKMDVQIDKMVTRGEKIGVVGKTGLVTGAHLHWELRVSGIPVDPLRYMEVPLIDKREIMDIIESIH
ncbi:M23 family metallopeptidase [Spirochaeta isovalerica]|uniref:Murein DD-endopeptidase MepM/ murein hydrolase activator NlpD n=1 Tax=Spirochaeta isovalerica TaxID=150 RepID=A0A841REZ7_9SPIO|nr:M23 family metallopeptidase [Spirochaeta isovalerica]MBB6482563.1 murein DD-endopeptidase MepM/ murein hydrolase activator NlpD [Spirochaeta isovalerica]